MSTYDPDKHHRHSIRLKDWDYSSGAAYFVTIVTHAREMLFGEIADGVMSLSPYGEIVEQEWLKSERIRKEITLDEFIIMPNHLHAIVWIENPTAPGNGTTGQDSRGFNNAAPRSLGSMIIGFKSASTSRINALRAAPDTPVWQRSYHDRIIRSEKELQAIREYIQSNPLKWQLDEENPNRIK